MSDVIDSKDLYGAAARVGYAFSDLRCSSIFDGEQLDADDTGGDTVADGHAHALLNLQAGFYDGMANRPEQMEHGCYAIGRQFSRLDFIGAAEIESQVKQAARQLHVSGDHQSKHGNTAAALQGILEGIQAVRTAYRAGLRAPLAGRAGELTAEAFSVAAVVTRRARRSQLVAQLVAADLDIDTSAHEFVGALVDQGLLEVKADPLVEVMGDEFAQADPVLMPTHAGLDKLVSELADR